MPSIGDALCKNTTYQTIEDKVRAQTNLYLETVPYTHTFFIKEISLAVQKWAKKLAQIEQFGYTKPEVSVTITGSANPYSISLAGFNPYLEKIFRLVHVTSGGTRTIVPIVSMTEAENRVSLSSTYATGVWGAWVGDSILLYAGSSFTITTGSDTPKLTYSRQPIVSGVSGTSYPDIPDSYINLVINEVMITVKQGLKLDFTRETNELAIADKEIMALMGVTNGNS